MAYKEETVRAKLILSNFDCSPEEITEILGISPHETWLCGDQATPKSSIRNKSNGWLIATPLSSVQESNLEKQIDLLMVMLEPTIDAFKCLPENIQIEVGCPFYVNDPKSIVLGVSSRAIQTMARINALLGIDLM